MATRATPTVRPGSEPMVDDRSTVTTVNTPATPKGRQMAQVPGGMGKKPNMAGEMDRRAPKKPHSA